MAHPYQKHNEHEKSHSRVGHILRHEPSGARAHEDASVFSRVKSKTQAVEHDAMNPPGSKAPGRYARGGKVAHKKGGHQTNIAIVVPHHTPPPTGAGPQAGAGGPPPPVPAPPMGGGMPPPGLMGPGGPPGGAPMPPMRARGGKVPGGIATADNLKGWAARARAHSFASGGAATGVGRLEKAAYQKRHT